MTTPTTWTLTDTSASSVVHQRYQGGQARLRLDLHGGPSADASPAADDFLERCRTSLASSPEAVTYRKAVEQATAARETLDRIAAETADAQSKRQELLDTLPAKPDEKATRKLADADRKLSDLAARCDDAQRALRLLHRRAAEARAAVEDAAQRIGRQTLASLRRDVQARWDETVAKIPAAVGPLLDTLLSLDAAQGALASDGRAGQAALLVGELPALLDGPEPEPAQQVEADHDDEQDVIPLASAG